MRRGKLAIDRAKVKAAARHDGKWVLMTNDDSLSVEDIGTSYKSLLVIERCFRSLKTAQIRLRPMFHRLERRIEAHVKLCVLALLVERVVELRTNLSWARVRHTLRTLQAVEFRTARHRFFRRSELTSEVNALLQAIDIKPPKQLLAAEGLPVASSEG